MSKTYESRKFRKGLFSMFLIAALGVFCLINPVLMQIFDVMVGGIVSIFAIYCGLNVANKWVLGRAQGASVHTAEEMKKKKDILPEIRIQE